ncbi:MAG: 3-oxoadipyl-CoA thiolase [Rhizobiales bacterium]|nr:3-oxoadipyl-CoA thiolase [Hyphomicrobiales bacterium]
MSEAYIIDGIRTPIGRFGGALSSIRPDDMAAMTLKYLMDNNQSVDWSAIDDVIMGCANQAGEDNRNIGRMAVLLSGLPKNIAGTTVNRLCGSGLDTLGMAARAIKSGDAEIMIAAGVESMSRAPFVMPKAQAAFSRTAEIYDTTIGWRFVNKQMKKLFGTDSMPETAENVAEDFNISRQDQDLFAYNSQVKAKAAQDSGRFAQEIMPVTIPQRKKDAIIFEHDEHLRLSSLDKLAKLATPFRDGGSVTAGNASGVNDGAAALLIAGDNAVKKYNLKPIAKIVATVAVGVDPRIMGIGPAPAIQALLAKTGKTLADIDLFELNEAFAAQGLAVLRELGMKDDDPRVNPNGGAISLGHPLGMSGTRLALTAAIEMKNKNLKFAICTMCIGVGQGIAVMLENVS